MDGDATRVRDELRRSKRDEQSSVTEDAQVSQHGLSLRGITPSAGALVRGRANGPVRVQAMRAAQSTYGNFALRRSLSSGVSLPVQRTRPPLPAADEVPEPYRVSGEYAGDMEDEVPEPYRVSSEYAGDMEDEVPEPYAISGGYPGGHEAFAAPSGGSAQGGRFKTLGLGEHYQGEDTKANHYKQARGAHISTRYLRNEEERAPYQLGVGAGGKIMTSESKPLSTGTAKGMFAGGAGGHIFAMSPEGQFYSASAQAENKKGGLMGAGRVVAKEDPSNAASPFVPANNAPTARAQAFHHSSFLGGGDVASAGELKANEGVLSMISNASGHYKPGSEHIMQALQHLEGQGVATQQARVHLMGDYTDGKYDDSKEVTSAVGEYKSAGGDRDALVGRHNVLKELRQAFGVRPDDAGKEPQRDAATVLQNVSEENLQKRESAEQAAQYLGDDETGDEDEYPYAGEYPSAKDEESF